MFKGIEGIFLVDFFFIQINSVSYLPLNTMGCNLKHKLFIRISYDNLCLHIIHVFTTLFLSSLFSKNQGRYNKKLHYANSIFERLLNKLM